MTNSDKRFRIAVSNDNTVRLIDHKSSNNLISIGFKEHNDAIDCSDALQYLCNLMNGLTEENEQLKSTIAQLIEQNRKNNDLFLSDIRILEKALWCGGCENDYGRLNELRKEFMK